MTDSKQRFACFDVDEDNFMISSNYEISASGFCINKNSNHIRFGFSKIYAKIETYDSWNRVK
jgi:hypothetical protein